MESNRIDPNRKYTAQDMMTAGFSIAMAAFIFLGVAYIFFRSPGAQNLHAAYFFGITFVFLFVMGAGTFLHGWVRKSKSPKDKP